MMRKMTALLLALVLITSQLALPTMAETSDYHTTESQTTESGGAVTTTDTEKWQETTTEKPGEPKSSLPAADTVPGSEPNSEVTTEITGSSTTSVATGSEVTTTVNTSGSASQEVTGSETTDITTTVTITTTTTNTELSQSSTGTEPAAPDKTESQELKDKERTEGSDMEQDADANNDAKDPANESYVKDPNSEKQVEVPEDEKYQSIQIQSDSYEGTVTMVPPQGTQYNTAPTDTEGFHLGAEGQPGYYIEYIKNADGETIGYTRTPEYVTAADTGTTTTVTLSNAAIAAGNFPAEGPRKVNGKEQLVKYTYDKSGAITGYTVKEVQSTQEDTSINYSKTDPAPQPFGGPMKENADPAKYTENGAAVYQTGSFDIKDANGNVIGQKKVEAITEKDAKGNDVTVGYTITETVYEDVALPGEKVTDDPDNTDGKRQSILPTRPVPQDYTNAEGMPVTQTVEDITDASGNVIGYKLIEETRLPDGTLFGTSSQSIYATEVSEVTELKETPESAVKETTTVTEVRGVLETQLYTQDHTGTTEDTRVIKQDAYTLIPTEDGGLLASIEGTIYRVEALGGHGKLNFTATRTPDINGLTPAHDSNKTNGEDWTNYLNDMKRPGDTTYSSSLADGFVWQYVDMGLESRIRVRNTTYDEAGKADIGENLLAHQFVLEGKDENGNTQKFYVYCADFEVSAVEGESYNMDNIADADYIKGATEAERQQKVTQMTLAAVNGYWGVADQTKAGSLTQVRELMKKAVDTDNDGKIDSTYWTIFSGDGYADSENSVSLIDKLTDGEALTATQAALWLFGDSGKGGIDAANMVGRITENGTANSSDWNEEYNKELWINAYNARVPQTRERAMVHALVKVLSTLDPASNTEVVNNTGTELLDKNNFATSVTMAIDGKVTPTTLKDYKDNYGKDLFDAKNTRKDSNGTDRIYDPTTGEDLYNATISFTVAVQQSHLTGNLWVSVVDEHQRTIARKQITTDESNVVGKILAEDIGPDTSSITFSNLVLPSGVRLTLKIDGTQDLDEGAYLFTAANYQTAQTFIGVASGEQTVDLAVDMKFEVNDPQLEKKSSTWTETDTDTFRRQDTLTDQDVSITTTQTITTRTTVKGTKVHTRTISESTRQEREWNSYIEYLFDLTNGEGGAGGGAGGNQEGFTIPDEAVPLAAAPATGDASQILATICLISLSGAYLMSKKGRIF